MTAGPGTSPDRVEQAARSIADRLGAVPEAFAPVYWRHRRAYDLGLSAGEYWRRVATDLSLAGTPPADDLIAIVVDSWMSFRVEMWQLAAGARAAGIRTAVLSNGIR